MHLIYLYLQVDIYNLNNELPIIDKQFTNCCMKINCLEKSSGTPPKKKLTIHQNQNLHALKCANLVELKLT